MATPTRPAGIGNSGAALVRRLTRRPLRLVVLVVALALAAFAVSSLAGGRTGAGDLAAARGISSYFLSWRRGGVLGFVDPLIGTTNGGHVFPGATLPYGMAKPGPDTDSRGENAAGFVSDDSPITGFSQLHDSGTGGAASLGNFPLFVHPGCNGDEVSHCAFATKLRQSNRVKGSAAARPGYFTINLTNALRAEMTATSHTSLFRFSFPPGKKVKYIGSSIAVEASPVLLLDVQDLAGSRRQGTVGVSPSTGRIMGGGKFRPSFGNGAFDAYFCADVGGAKIRHTGVFTDNKPSEDEEQQALQKLAGRSAGAWIQFERLKGPLYVRVGLSFISQDKACANAEAEIPEFASQSAFDGVVAAAEDAWAEKLSPVQVDSSGVSEELQKVFWSGLYRTMLSPQNYTGENQLWESKEPYFDSFYCIWDSFRAQHPLLTILDPPAQAEMVRALLDIYRHEGKLPDCRMSFSKGFTQGGSNADVVLADAFVKELAGDIDWKVAYAAAVADAEESPPSFDVGGRGNIEAWKTYGYVPVNDRDGKSTGRNTRSVSRTVEYAYDDFAIATLAKGLGRPQAEVGKYLASSGNWKNVWNKEQIDFIDDGSDDDDGVHGYQRRSRFVGFPQPRLANGTFGHQNTRTCSPVGEMHRCYLDTRESTYEGSPWLYSFYVPHDMAGLAGIMGGRAELVARLEYYHESGIAYMGNEQAFLTVFQFHYGGRPGLSSRWVRNYIPAQFNATVGGLPGNDDCAMGAFTGMAMMGFFPVAGQDVYLLIPPFFREVRLRATNNKNTPTPMAVIRRVGPHAADSEAIYIQRATLNGRPYALNWITHRFFADGGVLELEVGKEEGEWGTREVEGPPSYS